MPKIKLTTKIFFALILGVIVGLLMQSIPDIAQNYIKPFGILFIHIIKMVIVPLVFSSLIVGVASIGDPKLLGRIGGKTLAYYLLTTAIAVFIGLLLGAIFKPGSDLSIPVDASVAEREIPSLVTTLINIIPKNALHGIVEGNILQIITFALFLGISCTFLNKEKTKGFVDFFESLAEIMYKITSFVMKLAPYGVFALVLPTVASYGVDILKPLVVLVATVYSAAVLHVVCVYFPAVRILGKMHPLKFFKAITPAFITAFSTCSSSGTLPVTIKSTREDLGVSERVSSFVLPLGATINMDGTSLYLGVCTLFAAQVYGVDLTFAQMGVVILTATLGSIGTAGVPGAGFIMLTLVLESVGLPLEALALILSIDRVLDMIRTAVNIVGDTSCALIVAQSENEIKT